MKKIFTNVSVIICKNQAIREKSETCMSKTNRSSNKISLKDELSIWEGHYLISASLDLFRNFHKNVRKIRFLTELHVHVSALEMFIYSAFRWNNSSIYQHDMEDLLIVNIKMGVFFIPCFTLCLIFTETDT